MWARLSKRRRLSQLSIPFGAESEQQALPGHSSSPANGGHPNWVRRVDPTSAILPSTQYNLGSKRSLPSPVAVLLRLHGEGERPEWDPTVQRYSPGPTGAEGCRTPWWWSGCAIFHQQQEKIIIIKKRYQLWRRGLSGRKHRGVYSES